MAPFDILRFGRHFFHFAADFVTLSYTKMAISPTLLYTASLKKEPLSGGASHKAHYREYPPRVLRLLGSVSFYRGGGPNPLAKVDSRGFTFASRFGPGGPFWMADLDRGSNSGGGTNPLGHRPCFLVILVVLNLLVCRFLVPRSFQPIMYYRFIFPLF